MRGTGRTEMGGVKGRGKKQEMKKDGRGWKCKDGGEVKKMDRKSGGNNGMKVRRCSKEGNQER